MSSTGILCSGPRSKFVLLVAAAALVAGAAVTTIAVPVLKMSKPAVIATVSLEDVFNQLNERSEAATELLTYQKGFQGELDKLGEDLKNQQSKLEFTEGTAKKDAAVKLIEMRAAAKVRQEVCQALIDQRQGEVFAAIYRKIEAAAKQLAQKNGYTLVVVTDENVKVPDGPSADTQRIISLKRFLFVDKEAHDITGDLVTMMNNEFKAGLGAGAAPPVAPGAPAPGAPKR